MDLTRNRGPLDGPLETFHNNPVELTAEGTEKLKRLVMLEKKMDGVDKSILDVEQHIIDRLKAESGASNIKLLAEALEITRKLERRERTT